MPLGGWIVTIVMIRRRDFFLLVESKMTSFDSRIQHAHCGMLASLLVASALLASGCDRKPAEDVPVGISEVERNAAGQIMSVHIACPPGADVQQLAVWLSSESLALQSMTLDGCNATEQMLRSFGDLSGLRELELRGCIGWLQQLKATAVGVESVSVVEPQVGNAHLRVLAEYPRLRKLSLISHDGQLRDLQIDGTRFLEGLDLELLRVSARKVIFSESPDLGVPLRLQRLTVFGECGSEALGMLSGGHPMLAIDWMRVVLDGCTVVESRHFSKANTGDWREMRTLSLGIQPQGSLSDFRRDCEGEGECPSKAKILLNEDFASKLREAVELRHLHLAHAEVDDVAWEAISQLPRLETLSLDCCDATASQLKRLAESSRVATLTIGRGEVTVDEETKELLESEIPLVIGINGDD